MGRFRRKKIKIFVDAEVITLDHFSGIGHYTASLLKALDGLLNKEEYSHIKVTLGVPLRKSHKLGRYEFQNFGVRRIPLPARYIFGLKVRGLLPPIDLMFGKQIYLFPNYSSWPTLFSKSVPIIYDLSFIKFPQFGDTRNMEFLVDQVAKSAKYADQIITISTNSRDEICEEYKVEKSSVSIVYPIIENRSFYRRSIAEIKEVKAKYGVFDSYILYVGNLEPRKNLVTLLAAYEKLPKEIQNKYSLLLVGAKGWKDDEIYKKIQQMRINGLRIVQPVSYVIDEDVPALISGASLFVYVSVYEGFGIPPVEALSCGTPVVSSNNSSLPEACGEVVRYVEAMDADDISKALEEALLKGDKYDPIPGYKQAAKFDAASAAKKFVEVIENLKK